MAEVRPVWEKVVLLFGSWDLLCGPGLSVLRGGGCVGCGDPCGVWVSLWVSCWGTGGTGTVPPVGEGRAAK